MPGAVFLQGDKINLRTIEEEDIEFLRDNINEAEIRKNIGSRMPKNIEQERDFFEEVISSDEDVHLAISREEDIIGIVSLEEHDKDLQVSEIGIWIEPEHHGNGYGTEAARLITDYGFNELNLHKIMARVYRENTGSQRIWEKLDFTKEGELREQAYIEGEFRNVYLYGILKTEWEK